MEGLTERELMRVAVTAGHAGHGKTALVRALAGDGRTWTRLPSGETLALVDVPGAARAVPAMLAGTGPAPAVLLAVAADQGWMPQTAEHLAALDAFGIAHGVLVVTRADIADPALARRQVRERVAGTGLEGAEAVTVGTGTGAGLDELRAALDRLAARMPVPDPDAPVRLWIDETRAGAARGTLDAGTVAVGDELLLMPAGDRVTVESLRVDGDPDGEPRERATGTARVTVCLGGVPAGRLRPGTALVTPGRWTATTCVDVRTRAGEASGRLARRMVLHVGAAAVPAALRPLGPDTARLTLNSRVPLHIGDTAVLRDPGRRTPAGVNVLDVRPPALVRPGAPAARARELATWPDRPGGALVLARYGVLSRRELAAMGRPAPPDAVLIGGCAQVPDGWIADPDRWEQLHRRLVEEASRHAAARPRAPGLPVEAARLRLGLPARLLVEALVRPPLAIRDGRIHLLSPSPALPARS